MQSMAVGTQRMSCCYTRSRCLLLDQSTDTITRRQFRFPVKISSVELVTTLHQRKKKRFVVSSFLGSSTQLNWSVSQRHILTLNLIASAVSVCFKFTSCCLYMLGLHIFGTGRCCYCLAVLISDSGSSGKSQDFVTFQWLRHCWGLTWVVYLGVEESMWIARVSTGCCEETTSWRNGRYSIVWNGDQWFNNGAQWYRVSFGLSVIHFLSIKCSMCDWLTAVDVLMQSGGNTQG